MKKIISIGLARGGTKHTRRWISQEAGLVDLGELWDKLDKDPWDPWTAHEQHSDSVSSFHLPNVISLDELERIDARFIVVVRPDLLDWHISKAASFAASIYHYKSDSDPPMDKFHYAANQPLNVALLRNFIEFTKNLALRVPVQFCLPPVLTKEAVEWGDRKSIISFKNTIRKKFNEDNADIIREWAEFHRDLRPLNRQMLREVLEEQTVDCMMLTNNLEIWQDGTARPCCIYRGSTGNIADYTSILNKQTALTRTLTTKYQQCRACWDHEKLGISSKRQLSNHQIDLYEDGTLERLPNTLEIKLSNLCNLACTTCGPTSSSIWSNKLKVKDSINHFTKQGAEQRIDNIVNIINQRGVNEVYLIGGEPTINPESYALLDRLIELKWNHNIAIRLVTNGVDIRDFLEQYFDKFYEFHINVSLDGTGSVFEYMRWGGRWADIVENMKFLGELQRRRHNKIHVGVTYTYSLLNLFHYSEFKRWHNEELPGYCSTSALHVNRVDYPLPLAPRLFNYANINSVDSDIRNGVVAHTNNKTQRDSLYSELVVARDLPRAIKFTDYALDPRDLENIQQIMQDEQQHYGSELLRRSD